MSVLLDRHQALRTAREEEQARLAKRVADKLRWMAPGGISVTDIWIKLGREGDVAGTLALLEQLAERDEVHTRDGLWYHGKGESRPARKPLSALSPRPAGPSSSCAEVPTPLPPRSRWEGEPTPPPVGLVFRSTPAPVLVEPTEAAVPAALEASGQEGELPGHWVHRRLAELGLSQQELARRLVNGSSRNVGSAAGLISALKSRPKTSARAWMAELQRELGPYPGASPTPSQSAPLAPCTGEEDHGVRRDRDDLELGDPGEPEGGHPDEGRPADLDPGAREGGGPGGEQAAGPRLPDGEDAGGVGPGPVAEGVPEPAAELGVGPGEPDAAGLTLPPPPPDPAPATLPELLRRAAAELEDGGHARSELALLREESWALKGRIHELERQVEDLQRERVALLERLAAVRAAVGGGS
jgi:hypothetical protein